MVSKLLGGPFESGGLILRRRNVAQIGTGPLPTQCVGY